MYNIDALMQVLEDFAPLKLSLKQIENGGYDNSGIIIKSHEEVNKILFSLDLSEACVKRAKRLGVDTIITHHPAIYMPIKNLCFDDSNTLALLLAVKYGMNVISMHLNLDVANGGIDAMLAKGLGANKTKVLDLVDGDCGYGREFELGVSAVQLAKNIRKEFGTDKIIIYGNKNTVCSKVASFCGGGASHALDAVKKGITDAELIVTSDVPHHVIKELVELDKVLIILPHYVAENYGFNKFYQRISEIIEGEIQTYYFEDKRFI